MELTAAIAVIAALLTNLLTAVSAQPSWTAARKRIVSGAIAVVLGVIVAVATGQIDGVPDDIVARSSRILITVAIIITISQGLYRQFKGSLTALEQRTAIEPARNQD